MRGRDKLVLALVLVPAVLFVAFLVLCICTLLPVKVPSRGMAPTISPGDHLIMERITFLAREPRRGDVVVFKSDGIPSLTASALFNERVVGEPGDQVRISEGKLFINGIRTSISNVVGEIVYNLPPYAATVPPQVDLTVPARSYFVLGDNSTNSFDSRFWGCVPRANIIGRIGFCYWPPDRIGAVK